MATLSILLYFYERTHLDYALTKDKIALVRALSDKRNVVLENPLKGNLSLELERFIFTSE